MEFMILLVNFSASFVRFLSKVAEVFCYKHLSQTKHKNKYMKVLPQNFFLKLSLFSINLFFSNYHLHLSNYISILSETSSLKVRH